MKDVINEDMKVYLNGYAHIMQSINDLGIEERFATPEDVDKEIESKEAEFQNFTDSYVGQFPEEMEAGRTYTEQHVAEISDLMDQRRKVEIRENLQTYADNAHANFKTYYHDLLDGLERAKENLEEKSKEYASKVANKEAADRLFGPQIQELEDKIAQTKTDAREIMKAFAQIENGLVDPRSFFDTVEVKKEELEEIVEEKDKDIEEKVAEEVQKTEEVVQEQTIETPTTETPVVETNNGELRWAPGYTQEQIDDAISRGISEPVGPEYEQWLQEVVPLGNVNEPGILYKEAEKTPEIRWAPGYTDEQITDAIGRGIDAPFGPEYEQWLNEVTPLGNKNEPGILYTGPVPDGYKKTNNTDIVTEDISNKHDIGGGHGVLPPKYDGPIELETVPPLPEDLIQEIKGKGNPDPTPDQKASAPIYWETIKAKIDAQVYGPDVEEHEAVKQVLDEKVSKYDAAMDTVHVSDKLVKLYENNKINRSKKYGIDKFFAAQKQAFGYVGALLVTAKNKIIKALNRNKDNEEEVWKRFRNALNSLSEEEIKYMEENINSLSMYEGGWTPVEKRMLVDFINERINKRVEGKVIRYYDVYNKLLALGNAYIADPTIDVSQAIALITELKDLKDAIGKEYSITQDRAGDLRYDANSRMSVQGQHYAASQESEKDMIKANADVITEMYSDMAKGNADQALLMFMKYELMKSQNSQIKKTILGEKFNGGVYSTTEVGALSHEKDTHTVDMIRAAALTASLASVFVSLNQKIAQVAEIQRANEINAQNAALNQQIFQTKDAAMRGAQQQVTDFQNGVQQAGEAYNQAVTTGVDFGHEIAGQSAAAAENGHILSLTGNYAEYDAQMHTIGDALKQNIEGMKGITTATEAQSQIDSTYELIREQFSQIQKMLESTATTGNTYQIERAEQFAQMASNFPTTQQFFNDAPSALEEINATLQVGLEAGQLAGPEATNIMLNAIPEITMACATAAGIAATVQEQKTGIPFGSPEVNEQIENIDQEKLEALIAEGGRTR